MCRTVPGQSSQLERLHRHLHEDDDDVGGSSSHGTELKKEPESEG
jgi:hypothetical protein